MKRHSKVMSFIAVCSIFLGGSVGAACKADEEKVITHIHEYDLTQWYYDKQYHWRVTTCGHDLIKSYRHQYDDEEDTTCNVCGYVRYIPPTAVPDVGEVGGDKDDGDAGDPNIGEELPTEPVPVQPVQPIQPEPVQPEPDIGDDGNNTPEGDKTPDINNNPDSSETPDGDESPDGDNDSNVEDAPNDDGVIEEEPSKPDGYIIENYIDGLEVEGCSTSFFLNEENRSANINLSALNVYLTVDGERVEAVPQDNVSWALYRGDTLCDCVNGLTAEGEYRLTATVIDAFYGDGTAVESGKLTATVIFNVYNPLTRIRLRSGTTEQIASPTDKMSAGWLFEGVRANGEVEPLPSDKIVIGQIYTQSAGTYCVEVRYGELVGEVHYSILPRPEVIKDVEISLKGSVNTTIESDFLTLGTDDFDVSVKADGAYSFTDCWLIYAGQSSKDIVLSADASPYFIVVKVCFEYTVEGERVVQEFERTVEITVTKLPAQDFEEPDQPDLPDLPLIEDIIVNGEYLENYTGFAGGVLAESAAGNITFMNTDDCKVGIENTPVTVNGQSYSSSVSVEFGDCSFQYTGFGFSLDKAATVRMCFSSSQGVTLGIAQEVDGQYIPVNFDYVWVDESGVELEYYLERGENYKVLIFGFNGTVFRICSMEILFT